MRVTAIIFLLGCSLHGAIYYVATSGSNTNAGTSTNAPWLTLSYAASNTVAGDTVLVQPGFYAGSCTLFKAGGSNTPITYKADGAVTNTFRTTITGTNIIFSGFEQFGKGIAYIGNKAKYVTVTNCGAAKASDVGIYFEGAASPYLPENAALNCTIINNRLRWISNNVVINTAGIGHLIKGNWIGDTGDNGSGQADVFRFFGSNQVISCNYVTNATGANHADIIQTFGDQGMWAVDILFERNQVVNCASDVQLIQAVMTEVTNASLWGIEFRNNLFSRMSGVGSISMANVKFRNNTFYKCSNGSTLLNFNWYDLADPSFRGFSDGSELYNNAFIQCSGYFGRVNAYDDGGPLTTNDFAGTGRTGSGYARTKNAGSTLTVYGTYTNLSSGLSNGIVYKVGGNDMYEVQSSNFTSTTFYKTITMVEGAGGYTKDAQWAMFNAHQLGFRINTTNFPSGEMQGAMPARSPTNDFAYTLPHNFNFVSTAADGTFAAFAETNGINGGVAGFVSTNLIKPMAGSVLIDAGTNIAGITNDLQGWSRTKGSAADIGCYEFDPALLMHLNFDENFTSNGSGATNNYVMDVSGYGNHGWQFCPTQWVTVTNGAWGTQAGYWETNRTMTDGVNTYEASTYLGVTNAASTLFGNLTNGTISYWAMPMTKGPQQVAVLLDGASKPLTNTFQIGSTTTPDLQKQAFRVWKASTSDSDGDKMRESAVQPYNTLWLFTFVWNCLSNTSSCYTNGVLCTTGTASLGTPYFNIGRAPSGGLPWLTIGASRHHTGDPQFPPLGADPYPNDCYFRGVMDDIRIYNRDLAVDEVGLLYAGIGNVVSYGQSEGGSTNSPQTRTISISGSLNVGRIITP